MKQSRSFKSSENPVKSSKGKTKLAKLIQIGQKEEMAGVFQKNLYDTMLDI